MKRAIVLLSGGIDSTTTLAIAKAEGFDVYALSFDYGQRHGVELESARRNAAKYDVKKHLVFRFDMREIGGSALTSEMEVPKERLNQDAEVNKASSVIPVTYVPARNTIFLSFALAWAETINSEDIFIGVNAVDYSGYPDCRPEYIKAYEDMANLATKASVEGSARFNIRTPLIDLSKSRIIKMGTKLGVDYSLTWSCYDPVQKDGQYVPCLLCDSCLLRAKGFKEADIEDPLLSKV